MWVCKLIHDHAGSSLRDFKQDDKAEWEQSENLLTTNPMSFFRVANILSDLTAYLRAIPQFEATPDTRYLTSLRAVDERMLMLVDIE